MAHSTRKCFSAFLGHPPPFELGHFWRVLFAAYFCAAFVTPQLVASRCVFPLPSGLCYSQPIDCTLCNQVQVQVHSLVISVFSTDIYFKLEFSIFIRMSLPPEALHRLVGLLGHDVFPSFLPSALILLPHVALHRPVEKECKGIASRPSRPTGLWRGSGGGIDMRMKEEQLEEELEHQRKSCTKRIFYTKMHTDAEAELRR